MLPQVFPSNTVSYTHLDVYKRQILYDAYKDKIKLSWSHFKKELIELI